MWQNGVNVERDVIMRTFYRTAHRDCFCRGVSPRNIREQLNGYGSSRL